MTKLNQVKNSVLREERAQAKHFFPRPNKSKGFCGHRKTRKFCNDALLVEQRAQAEAVFRLMIDSVVGLAILLVILSALNYFQNQVVIQSKADLFSLVKNAVNTPTGIVLKSGELTFSNGFVVDSVDFESGTNLSENCFELRARGGFVNASSDNKKISFNQSLKVIVYAKCINNPSCNPYINPDSFGSCCTQCVISFGSPLESD
ncbi:MAG: hypothetical protein WC122_02790 [archaeon]